MGHKIDSKNGQLTVTVKLQKMYSIIRIIVRNFPLYPPEQPTHPDIHPLEG